MAFLANKMKREIKFRGKSIYSEEWLYGSLVKIEEDRYAIIPNLNDIEIGKSIGMYEVYPETVGSSLEEQKGIFMIEIDLNDTVSVELTEWGATYLNETNIFKEITTTQKFHYKTDYKAGDVYKNQLWELILEFKDGIRFDKEKAFNKLKKVIDQ